MCNAKPFCSTALYTGYFVDLSLAIQAQMNGSEFTLVFCCTAQLVLVVNYNRKFFPPSLPLETWLVVLSQFIKQGSLLHVLLSLRSDFPQACGPGSGRVFAGSGI